MSMLTYKRSDATFWTTRGPSKDFILPVIKEIGIDYSHVSYPRGIDYSKDGAYYADGETDFPNRTYIYLYDMETFKLYEIICQAPSGLYHCYAVRGL